MIPRFINAFMPPCLLLGLTFAFGLCWYPLRQEGSQEGQEQRGAVAPVLQEGHDPSTPTDKAAALPLPLPSPLDENDPLFQQIHKLMRNDVKERFQDPMQAPSLSPVVQQQMNSVKGETLSKNEWHAMELLLHAARLLEEESSLQMVSGQHIKAGERTAISRRIRSEVIQLLAPSPSH